MGGYDEGDWSCRLLQLGFDEGDLSLERGGREFPLENFPRMANHRIYGHPE